MSKTLNMAGYSARSLIQHRDFHISRRVALQFVEGPEKQVPEGDEVEVAPAIIGYDPSQRPGFRIQFALEGVEALAQFPIMCKLMDQKLAEEVQPIRGLTPTQRQAREELIMLQAAIKQERSTPGWLERAEEGVKIHKEEQREKEIEEAAAAAFPKVPSEDTFKIEAPTLVESMHQTTLDHQAEVIKAILAAGGDVKISGEEDNWVQTHATLVKVRNAISSARIDEQTCLRVLSELFSGALGATVERMGGRRHFSITVMWQALMEALGRRFNFCALQARVVEILSRKSLAMEKEANELLRLATLLSNGLGSAWVTESINTGIDFVLLMIEKTQPESKPKVISKLMAGIELLEYRVSKLSEGEQLSKDLKASLHPHEILLRAAMASLSNWHEDKSTDDGEGLVSEEDLKKKKEVERIPALEMEDGGVVWKEEGEEEKEPMELAEASREVKAWEKALSASFYEYQGKRQATDGEREAREPRRKVLRRIGMTRTGQEVMVVEEVPVERLEESVAVKEERQTPQWQEDQQTPYHPAPRSGQTTTRTSGMKGHRCGHGTSKEAREDQAGREEDSPAIGAGVTIP